MKLEIGKSYNLKYTGSFCHCLGKDGFVEFSKGMNYGDILKNCIFVGTITIELGGENVIRQVFFRPNARKRSYLMFSGENLKHICDGN